MIDVGRDSTIGPLVKSNVTSFALEIQMKIWCYQEVPTTSDKLDER
jgi:hypothetical protein